MKKRIVALLMLCVMLVPVMASAAYYRVNTSSLKVRMLPEDNAQVLSSKPQDSALTVSKKTGNWSYVKFVDGTEGYVMSTYLTKSSSYSAWITSDGTPLWDTPSWTSSKAGTLAKGAKVTVLSHGKSFDYVKSSIGYGYVGNGNLSKKKVKASGNASVPAFVPASNYTAWVSNGYRTVNLRTGAGTNYPVIRALPTGTEVTVLEHGATWDHITANGEEGYMMTQYLTTNQPAPTTAPAGGGGSAVAVPYTAYVTSDNGKGVNVRRKAGQYAVVFVAAYHSEVTVLEHGATWDKITQNGKTGWIQNRFLTTGVPEGGVVTAAPPAPDPTPFSPYVATTVCKEGEKVNLRKKPWKDSTALLRLDPGTAVNVTGPATYGGTTYNGWVKVEVDGVSGYMMKEFLQ